MDVASSGRSRREHRGCSFGAGGVPAGRRRRIGGWQEPGLFARPLATPGEPFGRDDLLVGYEVAPGTYRAPGGDECASAHLPSFCRTKVG